MKPIRKSRLSEIVKKYETDLLAEWTSEQVGAANLAGCITDAELARLEN
jgi:hypothetical protein